MCDRGRRSRRGDGWQQTGRRDAVWRLCLLRNGPSRQPGGKDVLHEQRSDPRAYGASATRRRLPARGAARAVERDLVHAHARPEGRVSGDPPRCQGNVDRGYPGRQSSRLPGAQTPLCREGTRKETEQISLGTQVPDGDYEIQLGTVAVRRAGRGLTILANMLMVHRALAAAERLAEFGIDAEVVDVRCLVPLDMVTIEASVKKTGRVLIVEEDHLTGGWGAEVAARIADAAFSYLRAPIRRVAAPDTPIPCAPTLERAWVPDTDRITAAAVGLLGAR